MRRYGWMMTLALMMVAPPRATADTPAPEVGKDMPPLAAPLDTDGDGLADDDEDINRDGIRNPRETSPSRADTDGDGTSDALERKRGTDPNRNALLSFPEPLVYDLVRGLDSERGELELNVLALVGHSPDGTAVGYAPEIEWAFADGHAIELELPFDGAHLHAVKVALQGTLGLSERGDFAHGWQVLGELTPDGTHGRAALKWLGSARLSTRDSLVTMFGVRTDVDHGSWLWQGLANINLFHAVSQQVTLGIESNLAFDKDGVDWLVMPQVHVQVNHHFRLQWGLGAAGRGAEPFVTASFRGIVEL